MKKNVLIAMSGGVDSSVTAALLKQDGYDCQGAFMITHDDADQAKADAMAVAEKVGIKLHILDWRERFEAVLEYFTSQYKQGRTPNPCVFCNRNIKFQGLFEFAQSLGLDHVATGHYCRVIEIDGQHYLYKSTNLAKDQSYALAMVRRDIFKHLLLPVGNQSKDDIRKNAAKLGLGVEDKPDSQEICFIPDDNYAGKLESRCPDIARPGNVVDSDGNILGQHNGIHKYTIGQRRGLGIAMGKPAYVVSLDAKLNQVTLGDKDQLMHKTLTATDVNWLVDRPTEAFSANVKIRYNHKGSPATVTPLENNKVSVTFETAASAITPGQTAVFYQEDQYGERLIGGAWIDQAN